MGDNQLKVTTISFLFLFPMIVEAYYSNDPTRPLNLSVIDSPKNMTKENRAKRELTAIFNKNNIKFAIIDGKQYQENDSYQNSTIIKIGINTVTLKSPSQRFQLILVPKIKK